MLNINPLFSGEFDLMGFSQGTIISRYIIQHWNLKGKVRNFISFGGPLNGQSYTPCAFYNIPCLLINLYCSYFIFTDHLQNTWAPTNYFKDPNNYAEYLNKSTFLAEANNERYFSEEIRQKFLNLNRCMFIKWDSDGVLQPEESAWWGEFDINFKPIHRNNTVLYQKDLIGIKTLEMEGRAKFVSIPGKHMNYTLEQIDNIIVPFLHGR